jgi:protein-S-isoprenylcysteine O-methyltransferase Ste14
MTQNEPKEPNRNSDRAAVAFHPPVLLVICIVGSFIEESLIPAPWIPESLAAQLGIPVVVVALALFGWAVTTMRRGGASIPTHTATDAIVATGPFRLTRNPIYLSMMLLLVGIGLWANSIWFLTWAVLAVVLLTFYVIKPEERYLEQKFGEAYLNYKRGVRRWI